MGLSAILTRARALLAGEPLRAIIYGAAVVVWLVVGAANALGFTALGPTISVDDALTVATTAAVLLTELARRYVSPAAGA
jgi:hypothetical protein